MSYSDSKQLSVSLFEVFLIPYLMHKLKYVFGFHHLLKLILANFDIRSNLRMVWLILNICSENSSMKSDHNFMAVHLQN